MIRLDKLHLDLFGQFSGKTFDFGERPAGGSDFHVIYGPNEAGKTTTMEAFLRLLYGFDHTESYAFFHERKNLRVSGTLDLDGRKATLTRLPIRAPNLLDTNGQSVAEQMLQAHLGGLGMSDYRNLLCLDDETIERGGNEIVSAQGDIGSLLFSAAAGVGDLTGVLAGVRDQADALYKKAGSKNRVAELKRALTEIEKRLRNEDVDAAGYRKLRDAVARTANEEDTARAALEENAQQRALLQIHREAVPKLAEIRTLDERLAAHSSFPERFDEDPEQLVRLFAQESQAQRDIERIAGEIDDHTRKRDTLLWDQADLALANPLAELDGLKSRVASAADDLPRRRKQLAELADDMRLASVSLTASTDVDPVRLVLDDTTLQSLQTAREASRSAAANVDTEQAELVALADRLDNAKAALNTPESASEADTGAILHRHSVDALMPRHAAALQAIESATQAANEARDLLSTKGQAFDTLPVAPVTVQEMDTFVHDHDALTRDERDLHDEDIDLDAKAAALDLDIAAITEDPRVIDDAAADDLLARRNTLWQAHRSFMTDPTADTFETAMRKVDDVVVVRFNAARQLGELRKLLADRQALVVSQEAIGRKRRSLTERRATLTARLDAIHAALGIVTPHAPAALAQWVGLLERAHLADSARQRAMAQHTPILSRAEELQAELQPRSSLASPDFAELVAEARERAQQERDAAAAQLLAQERLDDLRREFAKRQRRLVELQTIATEARSVWTTMIDDAFPVPIREGALDETTSALGKLREIDAERRTVSRQVEGMEADRRNLATRLTALDGMHSHDTEVAAFDALRERVQSAQQASRAHDDLEKAIALAVQERQKAAWALERVASEAARIAASFPADVPTKTLTELRAAATLALNVIADRKQRAKLKQDVCQSLTMTDLHEAERMLANASVADLDGQLLALVETSRHLDRAHHDAIAAKTLAHRAMQDVTADAEMAELAETKATLELELQQAALHYLELHLGYTIAQEALRRYRDTHRSGMLGATEAAFRELTGGAYSTLRAQPDGGRETLIAIDSNGRSKRASDMSKGTRFQLYLALRAAAYEQLVAQGTVLPLLCDDVFETFDERRTEAACRLMMRVGRSGQSIYLTHHAHVVDIARKMCGDNVTVHRFEDA